MKSMFGIGFIALSVGIVMLLGCAPCSKRLDYGGTSLQPYLLALSVAKLDASISWYVDNLEFRLIDKRDFPDYRIRVAMLERHGFFLELVEHADSVPPAQCIPGIDNPALLRGFGKLSFRVDDAAAMAKKLAAQGVRFKFPLGEGREPGSLGFIVLDNDGNWLEITQLPKGT